MEQVDKYIVIDMLVKVIKRHVENDTYALSIAQHIEQSCYNAVVHKNNFKLLYSSKIGFIAGCLEDIKVWDRILKDNSLLLNIGNLTERDLRGNTLSSEADMVKKRQSQQLTIRTSELIRCPKCKTNSCTYDERQRRGSDEATTIEGTCTLCDYKFIIR